MVGLVFPSPNISSLNGIVEKSEINCPSFQTHPIHPLLSCHAFSACSVYSSFTYDGRAVGNFLCYRDFPYTPSSKPSIKAVGQALYEGMTFTFKTGSVLNHVVSRDHVVAYVPTPLRHNGRQPV